MTGALEVELIEERSALPLAAQAWNDLVTGNETNSVFQTFEWFDAWWRVLGGHKRLFFLLVRKEGQPVGFASLMLRRNAAGLRQLEFTGTGNADYQDFVLPVDKARALGAIFRFLRGNSSRWDRIRFQNIPTHSSTLPLMAEAARESRFSIVEEALVPCPTMVLRDSESIRRLLDKYSFRRPLNWFQSHGELKFRHVTSLDEVRSLLPQFFDQHVRRWNYQGRPSLFAKQVQRTFYENLAAATHAAGWLQFSVIEFANEPIAFHFGFDYCNKIIWYKPTFDVRYAARSPGLLLTRQLIEDALRRSRAELDFTIGDEPFKERFANQVRTNSCVSLYHSRLAGGIAHGVRRLRRQLGGVRRRLLQHSKVAARASSSGSTQ